MKHTWTMMPIVLLAWDHALRLHTVKVLRLVVDRKKLVAQNDS